jgi:hypothetical protein
MIMAQPPVVDPALPPYIDQSSLSEGHYGKPLILNRIFALLVLMIDRLQKTAASQANRLQFLSAWQKAYTDDLNQIHSFVAGNHDGQDAGGVPLDSSHGGAPAIRQDLNSVNSIYTQQIQGNNQLIGDDSKALQSTINQTTDAVTAQSDMATSILQQLSTILTSIYAAN